MRAILIACLAMMLASCGVFKRHSKIDEQFTKTTVDSAAKVVTETKRKIDTTVTVKADTIRGSKPADNLIQGGKLEVENDGQKVVVDYDPTTGNIRATGITKAREIPVQLEESSRKEEALQVARTHEEKERTKDVATKAGNTGWAIVFGIAMVIFLIILVLGGLLYFKIRRPFG